MYPALVEAGKLLRAGRYAEGFAVYEGRPFKGRQILPGYPYPEWQGEPLDGKTIFVLGEQGHGDEIMFVRFVPELKRRFGAKIVHLAVLPANMQLFRGMGANVIYDRMQGFAAPFQHYWTCLGSLPFRMGVQAPPSAPYLPRPPAAPTGKVGLAWRGGAHNTNDANRSLPSPDVLASVPNGVFLEPAGDMKQSAAQLAGLSALVTVCTSWAHLAGAMGIRTHVLAPAIHPYWCWGESGPRSPWYDSVRVHRQKTPGEWADEVGDVIEALAHEQFASDTASPPAA